MLVGLPASLVCWMAAVGLVNANGWVRVIAALVITIGVPALLVDRLLPDQPSEASKGLPTDVVALFWLGLPLLFAVALQSVTQPWLVREGDRLTSADSSWIADAAYLLAGAKPTAASTPTDPAGLTSATASTPTTASTATVPLASSSAAPSPSVTASASSAASGDAVPPAKGDTLTAAEIFQKYAPAVVTIEVKTASGKAGGTGFLLTDEGLIATNHHVIDGASEGRIKFMNGAVYEDITIVSDNAQQDLALLTVKLASPTKGEYRAVVKVTLGESDKVVVGERAISIGKPARSRTHAHQRHRFGAPGNFSVANGYKCPRQSHQATVAGPCLTSGAK